MRTADYIQGKRKFISSKKRQRNSLTFERVGNVKPRNMEGILILPRIKKAGKNIITPILKYRK